MSLERINVANTKSLFDDFSNLVFNAGEDGDSKQIDVLKEGEKVTGLKLHVASKNSAAPVPSSADLRKTLHAAVEDVLERSRTKFTVEAWGTGQESDVNEKMNELEQLVDDQLFGKDDEPLRVKDVKKIVVDVEALIDKLRKTSVERLLNLDQDNLEKLVGVFTKKETDDAQGRLQKSADKAAPYIEMENHYTAEFNDNYKAAYAAAPEKINAAQRDYDDKLSNYNKHKTKENKEAFDTANTALTSAKNELEKKKLVRFHEALKDENYCKAQLKRDHELLSCSEHRVDEINRFANAVDELPKDRILGFKGDTTAIFNKLVALAKEKGVNDPKILLRLFSDQRLFCGLMGGVSTTQEETVVRGIHPDVFAYMKALGLCERSKDNAGLYQYTTKPNGAPKMDATEGTIVKAKVDFAGKKLVDKPNSAYLLFAAELSFATYSKNFDLGGALMHWIKCHENDQDMQSASEKVRDTRILNVGKLITKFFKRQEEEWKPSKVASSSKSSPQKAGYHDGEKNIGGLNFEQYKKAIKILLFSKDKFDIPGDKELSKKEVNALIENVLDLAKKDEASFNDAVEKNYIDTLHTMYRARMQAANDLGIEYYIGGPAGCGVFDNDPKLLRDIEMYEFLMCGGRKMTYVVPVYDRDATDVSEANADDTKAYLDSMERMLKKIKSDKIAYMNMMRAELDKDGVQGVDKLSYEELVQRTTASRAQAKVQKKTVEPKGKTASAKVLTSDEVDRQALKRREQKMAICVENGRSLLAKGIQGLTKDEASLLAGYLTNHSSDFLNDVQKVNMAGMDILEMDKGALTPLVQEVLVDLVSPFRDLTAGPGPGANEAFKQSDECGPKSANDVELNRVWRQSHGNYTCFMMSVVNGLAQTERGVALLKERLVDGGIKLNVDPASPNKQTKVEFVNNSAMMFEQTLHNGYATWLKNKGSGLESFGEMGNAGDFGRVLGLVPDDAIMIGLERRGDKFMAKQFAMKVSKALKEGKVCTLFRGRHYRTIADVYLDRNGNPVFKILDSNQVHQVYDELVSESMASPGSRNTDGTGEAFIDIFSLPPEVRAEGPENVSPVVEPAVEPPVVEPPVEPAGGDNPVRSMSPFDSVLSAVDTGNLEDLLPVVNAFVNQTLNGNPKHADFKRYCVVVLELRHLPFKDDKNIGGRIDAFGSNVIRAELKVLLEAMRSPEFRSTFGFKAGDFSKPDFKLLAKNLKESQLQRAKAAEESARAKAEEEARVKTEAEMSVRRREWSQMSSIETDLRKAIARVVPEMALRNMAVVSRVRQYFISKGMSHLAFDGGLNFCFVTRGREKAWSKDEEVAILNESLRLMEDIRSGDFQRSCGFRLSEHGGQAITGLEFPVHSLLDSITSRDNFASEFKPTEEDGLL